MGGVGVPPRYLALPGPKPALGLEGITDALGTLICEETLDWITLYAWGYPARCSNGAAARVWGVLDDDGTGTIAATRDDLSLARALVREGFFGGGPGDPPGTYPCLLEMFAHTRGCAAFAIALARADQRPGPDAGQRCDRRNPVADAGRHARPDAALTRHRAVDGSIFHAWLEYDRGTERGAAYARSFRAYAREVED